MNYFYQIQNLSTQFAQTALPALTGAAIQSGLQDSRIGKIVSGLGLMLSGTSLMIRSDVLKPIHVDAKNLTQESSSKKALRWGAAAVGLTALCYGIYTIALGILELLHPEANNDNLFLVSHDNKPKHEQKLGRTLPRLGVVNSDTGNYQQVHLNGDALTKAKDLESLKWIKGNEYLACESEGKCSHFSINENNGKYSATTIQQFNLPTPKDKFFNIEAVALKENNKICWSHRGGIFAGEEPWTRCAALDLNKGVVGEFTETQVEDPFGITNKLNRAISDHAIGQKTDKDYFIATIDTEGSEGIEATDDQAYSFLYTKDSCLKRFPGDKVEALHVNVDETSAVIATDNEAAGSKVCTFSLKSGDLNCVDVRQGEEYGIGGIAPLKTSTS